MRVLSATSSHCTTRSFSFLISGIYTHTHAHDNYLHKTTVKRQSSRPPSPYRHCGTINTGNYRYPRRRYRRSASAHTNFSRGISRKRPVAGLRGHYLVTRITVSLCQNATSDNATQMHPPLISPIMRCVYMRNIWG